MAMRWRWPPEFHPAFTDMGIETGAAFGVRQRE
jgi:hypothetical protein